MKLFVARQPIFDLDGQVVGYELLYRRDAQSRSADGHDREQMSRDVVVQAFLGMGLERITHGQVGFLNFSREMLLSRSYELLDPSSIVVELLETVEADEPVVAECERLVRSGYRLAVDDYASGASQEPLLPLAEIVKVDVLHRSDAELQALVESLREWSPRLLAERVESADVVDRCTRLGFELFQGYHLSRPELVTQEGIASEQLSVLQLINLLRDPATTDQQIEEAFRRDPSLSYKLLRMINAAAQGSRGVASILHAVRLLGREPLLRWLTLLLASSLVTRRGVDAELVHAALLRARLCELLAGAAGWEGISAPLFMTGLFSRMDALLRTPMDQLLRRVNLADEVRLALLRREGPYAGCLQLSEAYEAGEWESMTRLASCVGVSPLQLPELYLQSLSWAREQLRLAA